MITCLIFCHNRPSCPLQKAMESENFYVFFWIIDLLFLKIPNKIKIHTSKTETCLFFFSHFYFKNFSPAIYITISTFTSVHPYLVPSGHPIPIVVAQNVTNKSF